MNASAVVASFASVASLGFVASAPPHASVVTPAPVHSCAGCAATKHDDPVTGLANGVQVLFTAAGFSASLDLDVTSKTCSPKHSGDGEGLVCGPDDVCEFSGSVTAYGPSDFRNEDQPHCTWSMAADPFGAQSIWETVAWIAACDDGITHANRRFFFKAKDCFTGTLAVEVHWAGKCSSCSGSPY